MENLKLHQPDKIASVFTTVEEFFKLTDEVRDNLARFADLLEKWNKKINLVGKTTTADLWVRHILDSAQLIKFIPENTKTLTDFGSGAGLPGLVLAILGVPEVHLIESNGKKASFMQEAARITNAKVHIHNERAETLTPWPSDVITARAFAPMEKLIPIVQPFLTEQSTCLFLKGLKAQEETAAASDRWDMASKFYPSITASEGQGWIVALKNIRQKNHG